MQARLLPFVMAFALVLLSISVDVNLGFAEQKHLPFFYCALLKGWPPFESLFKFIRGSPTVYIYQEDSKKITPIMVAQATVFALAFKLPIMLSERKALCIF